jgi:7-cyano-7-deazaguanine synthase
VFIDFGQKTVKYELSSARKISKHYDIELNEIKLKSQKMFGPGEIIGRNALLALIVVMYNPLYKGLIALGIHAGTPYWDCSESFVNKMNELLNGYMNGNVLLDAPFLKWDKYMIYQYCKDNKVPIHLTYSCETGTSQPCRKCFSCRDRKYFDVS